MSPHPEGCPVASSLTDNLTQRKPLPSEIDVFGVTHPGLARKSNADSFLIASFHRAMRVHASSLDDNLPPLVSVDSRGYLFLVADGVGSLSHAAQGSAAAINSIANSLIAMAEVSLPVDPAREQEVVEHLRASVGRTHELLHDLGAEGGSGTAATTLTLMLAIWPRAFVIHAGDSRCYRLRDGQLEQLTSDQTMAEALVEAGALSRELAETSHLKHVLVSAVGSSQLDPEITVHDLRWGDIHLLCSDGLTKHVTNAEIRDRLMRGGTAEAICGDLMKLALERGGSDNVTVLVGQGRGRP